MAALDAATHAGAEKAPLGRLEKRNNSNDILRALRFFAQPHLLMAGTNQDNSPDALRDRDCILTESEIFNYSYSHWRDRGAERWTKNRQSS